MKLLLLLMILASGGCTNNGGANDGVPIEGEAAGSPPGCTTDAIAARLHSAFEAMREGDVTVVDDFFGRSRNAPFRWYSMTAKDHFVAYNWEDLEEYLKKRRTQNEEIRLRSVRFNGWEEERGIVHMGPIRAERTADDLEPDENKIEGKGAYHCDTRAFVVLSLGRQSA